MSNELAPQEAPFAAAQDWLEGHQQKIAALLGKNPQIQERFMASVMNALRTNDRLLQAAKSNKASFLNAILQAAQAGLDIGGVRKHGALVPYKGEVTFIPQYQGLIHLMTSGDDPAAEDIDAEVIHENDHWELWKDQDGTHFKFSPAKQNPGAVVGAYACAYLKGGRCKIKYMPIEEIHRHRDRSASYQNNPKASPWHTDYEAMVRKTPTKGLANYLKLSNRLEAALSADNMDEGVIDMPSEPRVVSEHRISEQVKPVEIESRPPRKRRSPRNQVTPKPAPKPEPSPEPKEPEPAPEPDSDMPDIPTRKELLDRYMRAMKNMDDNQRAIILRSAAEASDDGDFNPAECDLELLKIVTEDAEDIIQ